MKISVVIPAYNGEAWVAQCIENIRCQSHKNVEIIVVDDGSTDKTAAIASSYSSVKVIKQTNQGQSVSRNVGAAAATGDYIHFMDVDDLIGLDYYQRMVEAVPPEINGGPKVDMLFGGFVNEAQPDFALSFTQRMILVAFRDKISVTGSAQMGYAWRYLIRRAFLEEQGLRFEPGRMIEDLPFTLEAVARAASIVTVPGAMYRYMKRPDSLLNTPNKAVARKRRKNWRETVEFRNGFLRSHGLEPAVVDSPQKI
ncbi:MAG: glycosyltransferase, partial [Alistipes sp.]|nr:glycosyltransferase [Alistipes sp.]